MDPADRTPGEGERGQRHYQSLPCRAARELRRRWHRFKRRWSAHGVRFIYHESYDYAVPGAPLDPTRAERILAFLTEEGLVDSEDLVVPQPPSLRNLLRAHTAEYLQALEQREAVLRILGVQVSDQEQVQLLDLQRLMVGGTIQATRLALRNNSIAVNLGGGFHHARRDSGMGFCIYNDMAVAITRLRSRGYKEPILVVDLDLHDGNGTRSIFADDPSVHTYSIHNAHWADTEAEASTSIALGDDVSDEVYLGTLLKTLPDVLDRFTPGLVIYLAGADPAADDPLGNWRITPEGMLTRDRFVVGVMQHRYGSVPMVILLAGGYGNNAWKYPARLMSFLLTGSVIEPPSPGELTLRSFRRIKAQLDPTALTSDPADFSWRLTDDDLVGIVPGEPRRTRFLGYFSHHGVELVLERFGILDKIRVRGFTHPKVALDLDHPLGETLRIFTDDCETDLLVELRVNRNQRVVPGMELLVIEWLLLQNPQAEFGPYRRPLPGQNHPGLGLLKDVFGWLVMLCEMLELDGVYYVPSAFHVAAQSHRVVHFLKPEDEARYLAVREAVQGMSLAPASRLVADGKVIDGHADAPFEWEGYPMVLPVSPRLKERFGHEYEERVRTERQRLDLHLLSGAGNGSGNHHEETKDAVV